MHFPAVRRSPEIVILIVLLVIMVVGVLWYVVDRRAKMRAAAARPVPSVVTPAGMVDIPDGKTVDFSSGHAVMRCRLGKRSFVANAVLGSITVTVKPDSAAI